MANIINTSYFVGDIEIPNVNQAEIKSDVNNSIVIYEKEVLVSLLGYPLWKELMENTTPVSGDKWDKLLNGEDFTFVHNNKTVSTRWEGLKGGTEKKSLIAYYVYFMHRRKRSSYNAGVEIEVEAEAENSKPSSLYEKLIPVWNEFVKMYGGDCVDDDETVEYYMHMDKQPSAYNYLLAKKVDFPTWMFTSMGGQMDRFGLY